MEGLAATRSASHDGRFAQTPIAPCEVQGYVYDAKRRMAELAREVLARPGARRPARARGRARCATRFDEAFWVEERGGFYALALDGDKQPVDSLLLEHRPPALERDRSAANASTRSSTR